MEGFKSLPKMQCFKEGGSVKYKAGGSCYKKGGHAESEDIAQDKKVVKKAFAMHDKQEHPGEKTDLSKLKKGGRMKKEGGCVGRYKAGGSIEMKKDFGDKDDIKKIKLTKTKKAVAPSAAMMAEPTPFKKGGAAKKYADGGPITQEERERMPAGKLPQQIVDEEATKENMETREMVAGPLRKLKQGIMEKFKSKTKTPVEPMKKGGMACR